MQIIDMSQSRRWGVAVGVAVALATALAVASPAEAAVSSSIKDGVLTVNGTAAGDSIALRLAAGDPNTLQVDANDDGVAELSFSRALFTKIVLNGRAGNDSLRVDQVNGAFTDEELTMNGGSGSDEMNGGDGVESFLGGSGNDFADGNRGNDLGIMGSGNDTFRWDPGDGNDTEEGQSGFDTLDFNGNNAAEDMDLSANGQRVRFFRNVAAVVMDLDGVERLDLTAQGSADNFTVNDLSGTDMVRADVDLSAAAGGGDGAADNIIVNGTEDVDDITVSTPADRVQVGGLATQVRILGSEAANDLLAINALGGDDSIAVREGVTARIGLDVDFGA